MFEAGFISESCGTCHCNKLPLETRVWCLSSHSAEDLAWPWRLWHLHTVLYLKSWDIITLLVDKWCCSMLWSPRGGSAAILRFGQKIGRKSLYKKTYVQLQEQRVWAMWDRWRSLKSLVDTIECVSMFCTCVFARISATWDKHWTWIYY